MEKGSRGSVTNRIGGAECERTWVTPVRGLGELAAEDSGTCPALSPSPLYVFFQNDCVYHMSVCTRHTETVKLMFLSPLEGRKVMLQCGEGRPVAF